MRIVDGEAMADRVDSYWSFHLLPRQRGRTLVLCCSMLASLTGRAPRRAHTPRSAAHAIAPGKPRGDFLAQGHAWINPQQTGRQDAVAVAIELNDYRKQLLVFGDRFWEPQGVGLRATDPRPFEKLPITYELAFGGPGYAWNPVGRGQGDAPAGVRLPNIVPAKQPAPRAIDTPVPAGFGPLDPTWLPRATRLGTYDDAWLQHHWPALPPDFDPAHWNEAPADQRFDGWFRGDERLAFENMHQATKRIEARLPGARARAFLATASGDFREVAMQLDTIDADLDEEQVELVWRGSIPVRSPRLRGIDFLYTVVEPLARNTDAAACRAGFEAARRSRYPTPEEGQAERDAARAAMAKETDDKLADLTRVFREGAAKAAEATRSFAEVQALHAFKPAAAPAAKPQVADPMEALQRAVDQLTARDPEQGARLKATLAEVDSKIPPLPLPPPRSPPPRKLRPDWTRARVIAAHAAGEDMAKADLTGLDLSGLDLRGARLADAVMVSTDLTECDLSGAIVSGVRLAGARLAGACFAGAEVSRTRFADLDCSGLRFDGARGEMTEFRAARLIGCRFTQAHLPRADFDATQLDDAVFDGASLAASEFAAARGARVSFAGCDLTNLRAPGSEFPGARFNGAKAPLAIWQQAKLAGADFSRAVLSRAIFCEADLTSALFDRAWMDEANLDDAILVTAVLTNARLLRISLERADLNGADLRGSNLYRAGLFEARVKHALFDGSLLAGTLLQS